MEQQQDEILLQVINQLMFVFSFIFAFAFTFVFAFVFSFVFVLKFVFAFYFHLYLYLNLHLYFHLYFDLKHEQLIFHQALLSWSQQQRLRKVAQSQNLPLMEEMKIPRIMWYEKNIAKQMWILWRVMTLLLCTTADIFSVNWDNFFQKLWSWFSHHIQKSNLQRVTYLHLLCLCIFDSDICLLRVSPPRWAEDRERKSKSKSSQVIRLIVKAKVAAQLLQQSNGKII